jgi:hypothetical protein
MKKRQLLIKLNETIVGSVIVLEDPTGQVRSWEIYGTKEFINDYISIKSNKHQLQYEQKYNIEQISMNKDIRIENGHRLERTMRIVDSGWKHTGC